eukprot:355446-Chlamydomonas_euryale.AAC.1
MVDPGRGAAASAAPAASRASLGDANAESGDASHAEDADLGDADWRTARKQGRSGDDGGRGGDERGKRHNSWRDAGVGGGGDDDALPEQGATAHAHSLGHAHVIPPGHARPRACGDGEGQHGGPADRGADGADVGIAGRMAAAQLPGSAFAAFEAAELPLPGVLHTMLDDSTDSRPDSERSKHVGDGGFDNAGEQSQLAVGGSWQQQYYEGTRAKQSALWHVH